jgi:hypothetical protein
MLKKLFMVLVAVILSALALGSVAFAQEDAPPVTSPDLPRVRWGGGEVIAIGEDNFTVQTRRGRERLIYVDANTQFVDKDGNLLTFGDLKVGDRVIGAGTRREDGKWDAEKVFVVPPRTHYKGAGVASVVEDDEFVFTSRRGKVWEFYVDSATTFTDRQGNPLTYAEVKVGSFLFVQAELRDDGKWWATEVRIRQPRSTTAP